MKGKKERSEEIEVSSNDWGQRIF